MNRFWRLLPAIAGSLLLLACAGEMAYREGLSLLDQGKVDAGLATLAKALDEAPTNAKFRQTLLAKRSGYVDQWLGEAKSARLAGKLPDSEALYRKVLSVDRENPRAQEGLEDIKRDKRHGEQLELAKASMKNGMVEQAGLIVRGILSENAENVGARELKREIDEMQARVQAVEPSLRSTYSKPVNLEFRDANVRMVFESLARTTGINFILDKDVRPDLRATVYLRNASIEDAIDLILKTSQLHRSVLNENTVLVYPNTPEKLKEYQDLVVKGFYLRNADVKVVLNSLKTLLKAKDLVVDEKLNLIVIRDTPEAVRLAEKLVALHDLSDPEVMLEVEVLEVQRSRLTNLGIQWPTQFTLTPLAATGSTVLTAGSLSDLNGSRIGVAMPATVINLRRDLGDVNVMANPRIRARNREKAKVMIGDRLPVFTSTTTATGIVSDSVQYLDVGLKLDVEPDIHLQDEVVIKVALEVSSLIKEIRSPSGTLSYQIGTRNASTSLKLKDGETQILAGLINDQDRRTAAGIPGLVDMPVLGRLFGSQTDSRDKTEIVLSITPRIISNLRRPDAQAGEFWSGTEQSLRVKPLALPPLNQTERGSSVAASASAPTGALARSARSSEAAKSVGLAWKGPAQVKAGESFQVELMVETDGTVRSLPFQLGFDPTAIQVLEVAEGGFFKQDNGQTTFSSSIDAAAGKVFVSVTRSDVEGAVGTGSVVKLTLRSLNAAKLPSELKVLSAAPIAQSSKPPSVGMPAPFVINAGQ